MRWRGLANLSGSPRINEGRHRPRKAATSRRQPPFCFIRNNFSGYREFRVLRRPVELNVVSGRSKSLKDCRRVAVGRKKIVHDGTVGWYLLELDTLHRS